MAKRSGKYNKDNKDQINQTVYGLALLGHTNKEMAEALGVSKGTIGNWKKQHPEFAHWLQKGKDEADSKVVDGWYRAATGHVTWSIKFNRVELPTVDSSVLPPKDLSLESVINYGTDLGVKDATIEFKEHAPNYNAAALFLANRRKTAGGIVWRLNPDQEAEKDPLEGTTIVFQMLLEDGTYEDFGHHQSDEDQEQEALEE